MNTRAVHAAVAAALATGAAVTIDTARAQGALEEIVVTATRREQNLQQVPISVVAMSGEALEMRGIDSLRT